MSENNERKQLFDQSMKKLVSESTQREEELDKRIVFERGVREGLNIADQLFWKVIDYTPETSKEKKKDESADNSK